MVTPPALIAAIPVGATIIALLCVKPIRLRKNVVLPVPAFPVRKTCLAVKLINFAASSAGDKASDGANIRKNQTAQYTL
ncbi:hypothetical protein D9M68_746070 [compost metagenome]